MEKTYWKYISKKYPPCVRSPCALFHQHFKITMFLVLFTMFLVLFTMLVVLLSNILNGLSNIVEGVSNIITALSNHVYWTNIQQYFI